VIAEIDRNAAAKMAGPELRSAGILTRDPGLLRQLASLPRMAAAEASVLVLGETGTGKELVARALHATSPRRSGPFVTVHCAALPASLLESELFGHVSGAFTGALRERRGRLASAEGGTLFLDEVGEIPLAVQAALLRFLQFGEIQRVGSDRVERISTRIVAATHRDLPRLIRAGSFREDLYYRLRVLDLHLPPLRERRGDIPLLIEHFLRQSWDGSGPPPRLSPEAAQRLEAYDFPGNVRELAHLLERVCILATGPDVGLDLLPPEVAAAPAAGGAGEPEWADLTLDGLRAARKAAVDEAERRFLASLMARHGGNVSQAARRSGLHRSQLQRLLARHRSPASPGTPAVPASGLR
jgi:Nif-specific regulatory protein/two-component system response regulator HydG